jgi:hypothetical protein
MSKEPTFHSTTRRVFIKQSTLGTLALVGMGPLFWTGASCAQTPDNKPVAPDNMGAATAINEVPYISTYYIQPKINIGKDAVIDYYVTDFDNKEFMADDHSETFTVDYWVNGTKATLKNIKAGDNSITLKSLPKGKVLFALQATDEQGRKSHRLFQEFLVVDPKEEMIPNDKIYRADLQKFDIYSDDTHPVETSAGLTAMLKWAHENGYRKVLLPQGKYRLDGNSTVQMATNLTLDMNGSTFKLNPNALARTMMFEMVNCFDSHVVNGVFEGDLKEHDFKKAPNNSEWVNAVAMGQGATYCSFENIKVVDVTGYGTVTSMGGAGTRNYVAATGSPGDFAPGDLNAQGNEVKSDVRMTNIKPVDLTKFKETFGFFQLGLYLGYQGNPTGSWVYKAHFYDANEKYLEAIEGYMYRRLYIPQNAKFVRITVYGVSVPEKIKSLRLFNFRHPYNCAFRNVQHESVRCVGMVPSGFINLLVEGCTFENCGSSSAKCAFDAEDGWDMAQDLTFRHNTFGTNPHNEFVCISGHNFTVENNVMAAYLRNRYYTMRNNQLKSANFQFGTQLSSGIPRVSQNTIAGNVTLSTKSLGKATPPYREFCIRDNVCQGGVSTRANKEKQVVGYFYKCKISGGGVNAKAVKCDIKNIENAGGVFEIDDSTVEDSLLKISGVDARSIITRSTIKNSRVSNINSSMLLQDNIITDTTFEGGSGWIETLEYILTGNKIDTSLEYLIAMGNSFKQIVMKDNSVTSSNLKFNGIVLKNPQAKKSRELMVAITKSTFNGKGGNVIDVAIAPAIGTLLAIYAKGNTYTGLKAINDTAFNMKTVKLEEREPPASVLAISLCEGGIHSGNSCFM